MPRPDELDRCVELAGIRFRTEERNFGFLAVRVEGGGKLMRFCLVCWFGIGDWTGAREIVFAW